MSTVLGRGCCQQCARNAPASVPWCVDDMSDAQVISPKRHTRTGADSAAHTNAEGSVGMLAKDWHCRGRVTPARSPCRAHIACSSAVYTAALVQLPSFLIFVALFTAAFDIRMCEAVSDRVRRCLADGSVSCCSLKHHFHAHCTGRNAGEPGATANDQPSNQLTADERASFDSRTACCGSTPGCTGTTGGPGGGTPGPNCDQNRLIPGLFSRRYVLGD